MRVPRQQLVKTALSLCLVLLFPSGCSSLPYQPLPVPTLSVDSVQPASPVPTGVSASSNTVERARGIAALFRPTATPELVVAATPDENHTDPLSKVTKTVDSITGLEFYFDREGTYIGYSGARDQTYLYVVKDGDRPTLRWVIEYKGSEWIFMNSIIARAGEDRFTLNIGEPDREVTPGAHTREWVDLEVGSSEVPVLQAILNSEYAMLGYLGTKGKAQAFIAREQRQAMRNILDLYASLGGPEIETRRSFEPQAITDLQLLIVGRWEDFRGGSIVYRDDGTFSDDRGDKIVSGVYEMPEPGMIRRTFIYQAGQGEETESTIAHRITISGDRMILSHGIESDEFYEFRRM